MESRENFEQKVLRDRLDSLYTTFKNAGPATLIVASLYVYIQLENHSWTLLFGWVTVLWLIYFVRLVIFLLYCRAEKAQRTRYIWLLYFRLGILATGIAFGSMGFVFFPTDTPYFQMISVIMLTGMAAGGLTIMSADTVAYTYYVAGLLSPVAIMSVFLGERLHYTVAVLIAVFLVITIKASRHIHNIVISSFHLRYENLSLLADLKEEKNRLDNRLGRILNDSLNELYILDGETLACLQVNKGALQNLGYSREELVDMDFLDIVTSLDRPGFDELTQPLRQKSCESLIYEGFQQRKDGSKYPVEINLQISSRENPPVFVATTMDITERNEVEQKLIYQANYDQLTGLPNRHFMVPFIEKAFSRADRNNTLVALLFLDLNKFKDINDAYGHAVGDKLLALAADRLQSVLRNTDTPARIGGDEFLVVLEGFKEQSQVEVVVYKIISSFQQPFLVESQEINTSTCIGISIYPNDGNSVDLLMQYADTAMYSVKEDAIGHCKYRFFSQELRESIDEQLRIMSHLQHALENDELRVFYQPKVNIHENRIVGAEALLRWHNPELGDVPPYTFIPIAEKYGLIESIGSWVMEEACREAAEWQAKVSRDIHIAVNISPQQFRSRKLLEHVDYALQQSGLEGRLLEVEITESLLMQDTDEPLKILQGLQAKKIKLSLDDFGTGYSSLSYLKRFPLQVLKIDRSFIFDLLENHYNRALVEAIIAMANSLELELVAEGVETREQLEFLRERMVSVVQGYLFSRPVPSEDFRTLLETFEVERVPEVC